MPSENDIHAEFKPDKPFRTYDEQLDLLELRNLNIDNREAAKHFLQTYSYYDLINGNIEYFLKSRKPIQFKDNVEFMDLVKVRFIEEQLKQTLLSQILNIEKNFKTQLSYAISKSIGVDSSDNGYLANNKYSNEPGFKESVLSRFRKIRDLEASTPPSKSLKHYKETHNHIPPWILINDSTFGDAFNLYRILKLNEKEYVVNSMISYPGKRGSKLDIFITTFKVLREFRNSCAHNNVLSKTSTSVLVQIVKIERLINDKSAFDSKDFKKLNINDIWGCIISIVMVSNDLDQTTLFLDQIQRLYKLEPTIFTNVFKLPDNFITVMEKLIKDKFNIDNF